MGTVPELRDRLCIIALLQSEKLEVLNLAKILIEFAGLSGTGKSSLIRELRVSYGYPPPNPKTCFGHFLLVIGLHSGFITY